MNFNDHLPYTPIMKSLRFFQCVALIAGLFNAAAGAAPATLTLNDLQNHPERWPSKMTLSRDYKFNGGSSAHKGQTVQVVEVKGAEVVVDAGKDLVFSVPIAGGDFLAAANSAWSTLTPAQRDLDASKLMADPSLWPLQVKSLNGFRLENGAELPAGSDFDLVSFNQEGVSLFSAKYNANLGADLKDTDLIARARALLLVPASQRPSRIAAALHGNLVDANGRSASPKLDETQVFALYYGASWCPPCRKFSPGFVKYIDQVAAQNPKLTVVLMSNDKVDAEMFKYMKSERMPWVAMPLARLQRTPLLLGYTKGYIPQLVIVDRSGKILADSYSGKTYVGPEAALKGLTKLVDAGAVR
jgi:thiol-disulfide isomerase/thioredoxin